jgi:hypothetical protein
VRRLLLLSFPLLIFAQSRLPRFEDFPANTDWNGHAVPPRPATAPERLFRTRLLEAAKESPNFAGHYRLTTWGCGSECISGAIVDLATGEIIAPPLANNSTASMHCSVCQSAYEGSGVEVRLNSRLMIVRCGLNDNQQLQRNVPDAYYFVLEAKGFRSERRAGATGLQPWMSVPNQPGRKIRVEQELQRTSRFRPTCAA